MSSELSARAISQITTFLDGDYWLELRLDDNELSHELRKLDLDERAQHGHRFLKRHRVLRSALREKDVRDIFAHGKPLVFDEEDYRRLLVPEIVEAFQNLTNEPLFLDVTVAMPMKDVNTRYMNQMADRTDHPTEVWPRVYDSYQPCSTTVETSSTWRINGDDPPSRSATRPPLPEIASVQYAVETFYVTPKHSNKQLVVQLHFALGDPGKHGYVPVRPPTAPSEEKLGLHKMTVRLVDGGCRGATHAVTRTSKSMLLIPDFASEVYGFVDRVNVGTSLVANGGLSELLAKLAERHRLPVHHLMCEFEQISDRYRFPSPPPEHYWLILHHFRRDLAYSDVRRFKIFSSADSESNAAKCALILRYLSNSHVADFKAPRDDSDFFLEMAAALVDRNFSLGRLRMIALDGPLTDYRSLDAVFGGGIRLGALDLFIHEDSLQRLIKTIDFLRLPSIQLITEFKLKLVSPKSSALRQQAVVSSPLWTAGIHHLRNCALYRVEWQWSSHTDNYQLSAPSERHLKTIVLELVRICEKFERGEIPEIVGHSAFRFPPHMEFPFNRDNKRKSGISVSDPSSPINCYTWDIYRFRKAATDELLTACVGHSTLPDSGSVLHIVKGEAYPDASYAPEHRNAWCS